MDNLYSLNRACTACSLRSGCKGPVPGVGPATAQVMLVGEAPGQREDEDGIPFKGKAGRYLDSLLQSIGVERDSVFITNTVKCRPRGNRTPTSSEVRFCAERWLDVEVELVKPRIVVAMGASAIRHFLGDVTVEHSHGIPQSRDGVTILPAYHPAAAFYDTSLMREVQQDFQVLHVLQAGEVPRIVDAQPVSYRLAHPDHIYPKTVALDTEVVDGELWSVQYSETPGSSLCVLIPNRTTVHTTVPSFSHVIVHNYLYDAQFVPINSFDDTMIMAYLLDLPQGLKELAWRLCGMEMKSYQEMVRPYGRQKAISYLEKAALEEWPDPPALMVQKWESGHLVQKQKKPQHISKKIKRILADCSSGKETKKGLVDPHSRWMQIEPAERVAVKDRLGVMPTASLADVPEKDAVYYGCRDADATLRVSQVLWPMIQEAELEPVYQMDKDTLPIALAMMQTGIKVDVELLEQLDDSYGESMMEVAEKIFTLAGSRFNPNSDDQLRRVLFQDMGFTPGRLTPTRLPSTEEVELAKIKHPIIPLLLEYRHLAHLKDSFCRTLPKKVDKDGRIHPTIKVTRTETGRWSMAEPNLQQIPNRTELGRAIRRAFVAEDGWKLVSADYSQIEMRVAAHLAQCKSMIQLFREDRDIHTETAAQVFGVKVEDVTKEQRYPAKTMGFGVLYGLTASGLADQMQSEGLEGWSEDRCREFIKDYYKLRPELYDWQEETKAYARRNGEVRDMFGRRRFTPEVLSPLRDIRSAGERQAINMPVQSGAQGIMKLAMKRLWDLDQDGVRWLLQIHDELLWEIRDVGWADRIRSVMEGVVALSVPLLAEVKSGPNWVDLE